jgi:hypothetical protein
VGLEHVEGLAALSARPVFSHWRSRLAGWAGEPIATRELCQTQKSACVLQAAPAVHEHKGCECTVPDGLCPDGETDESCHSDQAQDRGDHQTATASEHKPEQRAKDLTAIQWIDGKNVENQQPLVNELDR